MSVVSLVQSSNTVERKAFPSPPPHPSALLRHRVTCPRAAWMPLELQGAARGTGRGVETARRGCRAEAHVAWPGGRL